MTEIIDISTLDDFKHATGYDVQNFFVKYLDFIDNEYSNIINYYTASSTIVPTVSFSKLDYLLKEYRKIVDVFVLNAGSLEAYQYWALLEYVEDIGHTLETAKNSARWLRASVTSNGYKQQVISEYMTAQGQGLEDVERSVIRSNSYRDSWVDTALENDLKEEDYTLSGGYLIKIIYKNNASLFLDGIVDAIDQPKKTYGLDINKRITFESDDLLVLGYEDTLVQCAKILTDLKKEDDPSFPDRGINVKAVAGSNLVGVSYPTIFRELAGNFATDDSFRSLSIIDVRRQSDAILMDFSIETKVGDFFNKTITL
jgi:hypothetical protein